MKSYPFMIFALLLLTSCNPNPEPEARIGDVWGLHSYSYDTSGTVIFDSLIHYTGKELVTNNESFVFFSFDDNEYNSSFPVYKYKNDGLYMYRSSNSPTPFRYLIHPGTVGDTENLPFGTSEIMATGEVVNESPLAPACYRYEINNVNGFKSIVWFHPDYWFVKMEEWAMMPDSSTYYLQSKVILEDYTSH